MLPAVGRSLQGLIGCVLVQSAQLRLGSGRIDNRVDLGNPVRGKTALPSVLANQIFVGRDVNAINPIVHHVAFDPIESVVQDCSALRTISAR